MPQIIESRKVSRDAYAQAAATIVAAKIVAAGNSTGPMSQETVTTEFFAALTTVRQGMKAFNAERKAARQAAKTTGTTTPADPEDD